MSRLIDADALKDYFFRPYSNEETYSNIDIERIINAQPTIQPEPQKGKWKWIPVDSCSAFGGDEATWEAHGNPIAFHYCSECKEQAYALEDGTELLSDFCPNCGSPMGR